MSEIILHHYQLSPYSEKIRLALGLKGLSWRSVDVPVWTPRPKLTPMTGGYRRIPILQIGAEFYCDTLLILRLLEDQGGPNKLYPPGQEGMVKAFCWWIEKSSFMNAVCLTIGNMAGKLPQELLDERKPFFGVDLDPCLLEPKRGTFVQRVNAHMHWLGEILADGRKFIFGDKPTAASGRRPVFCAVGVARIERLQGMIDRPLGKEAAWRPRRAGLAEEQIVRRLRQQEAVPRRRLRYVAKPLHTHLLAPSDLTK
jgi:glutathione S-transferase